MRKNNFIHLFISCAFMLGFFSFGIVKTRSISLTIEPVFANEKLALLKPIVYGDDTLTLKTFRFYISHIQLEFESGKTVSDRVLYHLADAEISSSLKISLANFPEGKIKRVTFIIGVDSVANVSGALGGDLDPARGMYWAWNTGYICAKLEGTSTKSKAHNHEFEFHIGGYLKPYCASRKITLGINSHVESNFIVLKADAQKWLNNIDLQKNSSVVNPCEASQRIADNYSTMFSLVQ